MALVHNLGRSMLAPMFVAGGLDAYRHPETKVGKAATVTTPIAEVLGLPNDTPAFVRANAGVQVLGGTLLGLDLFPRLAAFAKRRRFPATRQTMWVNSYEAGASRENRFLRMWRG